jgi:hypothetical protein
MKVAIITDTAIIHGFAEGLHSIRLPSGFCGVPPRVLIRLSVELALRGEYRRP